MYLTKLNLLLLATSITLAPVALGLPITGTYTFADRPDPLGTENYGLAPATFGYASSLYVTFAGTGGSLRDPVVVATPSGCSSTGTSVVGGNTVAVTFGSGCVQPAAPGAAAGASNTVSIKVTNDFGALQPTQIIWGAPVTGVIPRALSFETNQDSEPSIAVGAKSGAGLLGRAIAALSFSRADGLAAFPNNPWSANLAAPMWLSSDGGLTWNVQSNIPRAGAAQGPNDQTLAFNSDGSRLSAAFLDRTNNTVQVRSSDLTSDLTGTYSFTSTGLPDQPWIQVGPRDSTTGKDRVYVALNDLGLFSATPKTATVLVSTDGGATFQAPVRIDQPGPTTVTQDSPAVRVTINGDTVYAAFVRYTGALDPATRTRPSSIVVVRDDSGGIQGAGNPNPFQKLGTGAVVWTASSPWPGNLAVPAFSLGAERLGSDLSIAADPSNSSIVYIAFVDVVGGIPILRVLKSEDKGTNWSSVLDISNAGLPSLSVAGNGQWGLLYTRLEGGRLITEFRQRSRTPETLASWENSDPAPVFQPYIGDYQFLVSRDDTFFGIFSASNEVGGLRSLAGLSDDRLTDFPLGIVYERNADFPGGNLLDSMGGIVSASIDPFFFTFSAAPEPLTLALFGLALAAMALNRRQRI